MATYTTAYPFSAIVGQDQLKLALILNAINPRIGGVLIRGEKGTAKSTAVRALAALLPEIKIVRGCPYACDPDQPHQYCERCRIHADHIQTDLMRIRVVTLPLNATEDRIVGGIDFNLAVKSGIRVLQPGLLAAAHRGILYVDEVNLLDDHIVDLILDAAASGQNVIEQAARAMAALSQRDEVNIEDIRQVAVLSPAVKSSTQIRVPKMRIYFCAGPHLMFFPRKSA
jgi:magnesium chelatase subunit D